MNVLEQVAPFGGFLQSAAAGNRDDQEHKDRALGAGMNDRSEAGDWLHAVGGRVVPMEPRAVWAAPQTSSSISQRGLAPGGSFARRLQSRARWPPRPRRPSRSPRQGLRVSRARALRAQLPREVDSATRGDARRTRRRSGCLVLARLKQHAESGLASASPRASRLRVSAGSTSSAPACAATTAAKTRARGDAARELIRPLRRRNHGKFPAGVGWSRRKARGAQLIPAAIFAASAAPAAESRLRIGQPIPKPSRALGLGMMWKCTCGIAW